MVPKFLLSLLFILCALPSGSQEKPWLPLWEGKAAGPPPATSRDKVLARGFITRIALPSIQVWQPAEKSPTPRPAVCIFPGGAYYMLATGINGTNVAEWAARNGMVGIVVKYRVTDTPADGLVFPIPVVDARRAIRLVRQNAEKWNIDPDKIGAMGFSAGGHLAAVAATTFDRTFPEETGDAVDKLSPRPDFCILIYPLISLDKPPYLAIAKRSMTFSRDKNGEQIELCTPYRQVTEKTPPLFLVHAADDPVTCFNSLDMTRAAKEANVPVELHLFRRGGHGFGVKKARRAVDSWTGLTLDWLRSLQILPAKDEAPLPKPNAGK